MPLSELLLTGRRYRLELTPEQTPYAERGGGICRFVWNVALEQRQCFALWRRPVALTARSGFTGNPRTGPSRPSGYVVTDSTPT